MVRGPFIAVALVLALVRGGADAGTILYASAASQGRVDGFCVGPNGGLAPAPVLQRSLASDRGSPFPRRLLLNEAKGVLYVAQKDRVVAFAIGPRGGLRSVGEPVVQRAMNPFDLALAPNGRFLYVPQRGQSRIVAFPINDDGSLGAEPDTEGRRYTSCIQGPVFAGYEALVVQGQRLYVSAATQPGRIQTFTIAPDGSLPALPDQCVSFVDNERPEATEPDSERRRINLPISFLLDGDLLYVTEGVKRRILAFRLQPDGNFLPPVDTGKKKQQQKPESRTTIVTSYRHLVLSGSHLIGSQFNNGRIEAYRLKEDGRLPQRPTRSSGRDLRASPVRMAVHGDVLYVSGGELDRIWAFRLDADGRPGEQPFSRTDEQKGAFMNDVAVAVLPDDCG